MYNQEYKVPNVLKVLESERREVGAAGDKVSLWLTASCNCTAMTDLFQTLVK